MEGIIAVVGFWLCMIAVVMKKPMMQFIELKRSKTEVDASAKLTERIQQLESLVISMGKDLQEVKDTSEFAHKLLTVSSEPDDKPKMLTTTGTLSSDLGKVIGDGTVRFERVLPASVEKVWTYLTSPDCLSQWLAHGSIEQRFGGVVNLNFDVDEVPERKDHCANICGSVSFIEPFHAIAFSWNDTAGSLRSNVSIQLTAQGNQTALVLTHSQLPSNQMSSVMAGWHTHLDILKARLANVVPPGFGSRYKEVLQKYVAVVSTTVVVSTVAASSIPAIADTSGDAYNSIRTERSHAMSRYDTIARDALDLKKQIAELRRDSSPEAVRAADRLEKQLSDDNRDMHDLNLELRDLDNAAR